MSETKAVKDFVSPVHGYVKKGDVIEVTDSAFSALANAGAVTIVERVAPKTKNTKNEKK